MKGQSIALFLLLGTLACLVQSQVENKVQIFYRGVHKGQGDLEVNATTLKQVSENMFNPDDIQYGLKQMVSEDPGNKEIGIKTFAKGFNSTAVQLYKYVMWDANFTKVLNTTMGLTRDPEAFIKSIADYKTKKAVNLWDNVAAAKGFADKGDFASCGLEWGKVILALSVGTEYKFVDDPSSPFELKLIGEPIDILRVALTGFTKSIGAAAPTDILGCFQPNAGEWVTFIGQALDKATHLTPFNIDDFIQYITEFVNKIPESQQQCLNACQDGINIQKALGIYGEDPDTLLKRVKKNAINHIFDILKKVKAMNKSWQGSQFEETGVTAGELTKVLVAK